MHGDEGAFAQLARSSADRLFAIAFRILRDTGRAEDATQQALVIAWRQMASLRDPDRFDAWLNRLLVNACYAEARSHRRWTTTPARIVPLDLTATPDAVGQVADRDQLDRGFRRLPPDQRAVVVFHDFLGLTLVEIADQMGTSGGTVKSRMHAATSALHAALDADARVSDAPERLA